MPHFLLRNHFISKSGSFWLTRILSSAWYKFLQPRMVLSLRLLGANCFSKCQIADIIPFSDAYLPTTAFIFGVAFKYGARLLPLLKTSLTSLLASSIAEEATILLNSPWGSGRTTLS